MKKLVLAITVGCLLFAQESIDEKVVARIRSEEMEHSQIMRTLHILTDRYGPRVTGTPNHEAAAKWAAAQMTQWGMKNAHLEPWEFGHPGWLNRIVELAKAAGARFVEGPFLDFLDPWGNRIEIIEYSNIQFTKAPNVMRGMGLALAKNDKAKQELADKGMDE